MLRNDQRDDLLAIVGAACLARNAVDQIIAEINNSFTNGHLSKHTVLQLQRLLSIGIGPDLRQRVQHLVDNFDEGEKGRAA